MKEKSNLTQSFFFAFRGLWQVLKTERNFQIHLTSAFLIIIVGILLQFNISEWMVVVLFISIVFSAEIFNSSIENICDLLNKKLKLEYRETKQIRDTAAAAVLILSLFSALIGVIIIFRNL